MSSVTTDTRIVYGVRCTWWDSIDKVGHTRPRTARVGARGSEHVIGPFSLPCCPHCGSMLMETPDLETFMRGAEEYEVMHQGYMDMLLWIRGRCFPNMVEAKAAFDAHQAA